MTGVSFRTEGLTSKQVELTLQLIPDVVKIGYVVNVASGVIIDRQELESTCQKLAIKAVPAEVRAPSDLDAAFRALANDHVQAVIVLVDGMLFSERNRIAALAAAARLPAIYAFRDRTQASTSFRGWRATSSPPSVRNCRSSPAPLASSGASDRIWGS